MTMPAIIAHATKSIILWQTHAKTKPVYLFTTHADARKVTTGRAEPDAGMKL